MKRKEFIKNSLVVVAGVITLPTDALIFSNTLKGNEKTIKQRVLKVLKKLFDDGKNTINWANFNWNAHFTNQLGMDSLDTVEFIMEIEKEFSISIPDAIAEKITTPKKMVDYLVKTLPK